MKEKIFKLMKDVGYEVSISLITALIIIIGAIFKNKIVAFLPNFPKFLLFIFTYWKEFLLAIFFVVVAHLILKVQKLNTAMDSLPKISTNQQEFTKQLSGLKFRISNIEGTLWDLNRAELYREAEKYHKAGQRGALYNRLEIVQKDLEIDYWRVDESLEDLFTYIKSQSAFGAQDLSKVKESLQSARSDGHKEIVNQIIQEVKNKLE